MKHMGTVIFPTVNCQVKTTLHKKTWIGNVYHEAAKDNTAFVRVICAFFSILAAEKSGCVKYADFWWRS